MPTSSKPEKDWRDTLLCAPVTRLQIKPAVLPVYTWAAERGQCMVCANLSQRGLAMHCKVGAGFPRRGMCIDERAEGGGCGPKAVNFIPRA